MNGFLPKIFRFVIGLSTVDLIRIFLFLFLLISVPLTVAGVKTARDNRSKASYTYLTVEVMYDKDGDGWYDGGEQFGSGSNPGFSSSIASVTVNGTPVTPNQYGHYESQISAGSYTVRVIPNSPWYGTKWYNASIPEGPYEYSSPLYSATLYIADGTNRTFRLGINQPQCSPDCSSGERKCDGSGYRTCGSYDADPCLDWSPVTSCQYGCSGGYCNSPPDDDGDSGDDGGSSGGKSSGGGTSGGGSSSGGGSRSGGISSILPGLSKVEAGKLGGLGLEVNVPYLVGKMKVRLDISNASREIQLSGGKKDYAVDLKKAKLDLNKKYSLVITGEKILSKRVSFTPKDAVTKVNAGDLILGDLDRNNLIDTQDQISLIDSISSQTTLGDLNFDTAVNSFDWAILLTNFGKRGN